MVRVHRRVPVQLRRELQLCGAPGLCNLLIQLERSDSESAERKRGILTIVMLAERKRGILTIVMLVERKRGIHWIFEKEQYFLSVPEPFRHEGKLEVHINAVN